MLHKKNISHGKIKLNKIFLFLIFTFIISSKTHSANDLEGTFTSLKILDKISSKNVLIKLKNGKEIRHKDLMICMKCSHSEFDDNPEITAHIQVTDTTKNNDEVFVFNGWMFSSPLITHLIIQFMILG